MPTATQRSATTTKPDARHDSERTWQHVATAAGAAIGGAAWISAVGSGIVALRLEKVGLPVEPVVALMSPEHRFVIGGGYLITPLAAALVAFCVDWAWGLPPDSTHWHHQRRAALAAVLVAFWLLKLNGVPVHSVQERVVIFAAVLLSTGIGALAVEWFVRPATFDVARIELKRAGAEVVVGGYVTTTAHAVLLVTQRGGCLVVDALPRDQIARSRVGPGAFDSPVPAGCDAPVDLPGAPD